MSLSNIMYSRLWIVILGIKWLLWLVKCLATVVLVVCLMSKIWTLNLSMILFVVCPTYLILHQLHFQIINKVTTLADGIPDGIVGFLT